jgi:hypothetical protein
MLLLELTSISVVVAARQKRRLRSLDLMVLERYQKMERFGGKSNDRNQKNNRSNRQRASVQSQK